MRQFNIESKGELIRLLLLSDTFDNWKFIRAKLQMENSFDIDGQRLEDDDYISWVSIKNIVYTIIRGNKLPNYMKIILKENEIYTSKDVGYIIDINFKDELKVRTGVSYKIFNTDKSEEKNWDDYVNTLFERHNIKYVVEE